MEKAVEWFRRQVEVQPDSARGYTNLGAALLGLGRYDEALEAFRKAVAIEPSGINYANLGTCQYTLGQFAAAAATYEKATSVTRDDATLWMNLGDARRWAPGQRPSAAAAYERAVDRARAALKVNPRDAVTHAVIASSLAKLGRSAEAAPEMEAALKLEPTNPDVLYQSAVVALLRHDRDGAAAWLRRATDAGYSPKLVLRDPELAELR